MFGIRYVEEMDKEFWFTLDRHLKESEFYKKVADKRGYIILEDDKPIGVFRFNLFWDNTPFLNLIHMYDSYSNKGYGRRTMEFWEAEMMKEGYKMVMTSTQVDESAQHFYRKLGYKDCGCLVLDIPGFEQPLEMFMVKELSN